MHNVTQVLDISWQSLLDLGPYFILALLIAAAVDLLCLDVVARRSFKRHGLLGILFTTCLGAFSPFCSFTVIPLIRRLLRGGVPLSAVMSFWIASPAMDPPIFALTAREVGLPLALARLIGALVLSIGAGTITLMLERRGLLTDVLRPEKVRTATPAAALADPAADSVSDSAADAPATAGSIRVLEPAAVGASAAFGSGGSTSVITSIGTGAGSGSGAGPGTGSGVGSGVGSATAPATTGSCTPAVSAGQSDESACGSSPCDSAPDQDPDADDGTPWWPQAKASLRSRRNWRLTVRNILRGFVTLGKWLLFACLFEGVISVYIPGNVVHALLGKGLLAIPLAVLISVPLYLNGIGAIPIVGGLLAKGMAQGAAVSFLLGGAVTTIPAMIAVRSVVNNRVFALYLGYGILGSMLLGFCAQLIL